MQASAPYGTTPYSPPASVAPASRKVPGSRTKWIYLTLYVLMYVLPILAFALLGAFWDDVRDTDARETFRGSMFALMGLGYGCMLGLYVAACVWIYKSWSAIPLAYRYNAQGRPFSPGEAVGYLFIPFYNLYWMFVMPPALCDAIDRVNHESGSPARAPRGLALAAAIVQLVPYANFLFAPIFWFLFMRASDKAKAHMALPL